MLNAPVRFLPRPALSVVGMVLTKRGIGHRVKPGRGNRLAADRAPAIGSGRNPLQRRPNLGDFPQTSHPDALLHFVILALGGKVGKILALMTDKALADSAQSILQILQPVLT